MSLHISEELSLPVKIHTSTQGLLAIRGAGKSNAARVMAEEMHGASLPFVAIDPVGSWWGLRSSRDGKTPGLPLPIFGGKHADVPLERGGGDVLADLVVEKRLSCVLDLSQFESESAKKQFLLAFATRLYLKNEDPLHLFLEEADDYIPQKPMRDEAQLLRAWENIVRRGRGRGLGITLITQRSAAINKMVLTQVETLIALRTTSPQDRAAIEAWIKYHAQSQEILESLPSLADGEAWIWSPHVLGKTVKVRFRRSNTFDSGATPKNLTAAERRKPATMADIDLAALKDRMASTIEKAKAEDPRELRRQIAQLKAELAKQKPAAAADPKAVGAARTEGYEKGWRQAEAVAMDGVSRAEAEIGDAVATALRKIRFIKPLPPRTVPRQDLRIVSPRPPSVSRPTTSVPSERMAPGEKAILTVCAQYSGRATREQITVLTGYKRSSRDTYLQRLQSRGYIEVGATISANAEGIAALGPGFEPMATGAELRAHWLQRLPEGERKIFIALVDAYPNALPRDAVGEASGLARSSRDTYIQRLRSRQLVEVTRADVRASAELFEGGSL